MKVQCINNTGEFLRAFENRVVSKVHILILVFFSLLISPAIPAQIYYMQNKFVNIPHDILDNINQMGLDDNLFLTELEGNYFHALYLIEKKEFNLVGKKVGFLTGSLGKTESNKETYFIEERNSYKLNHSPNPGTLYIFNEEQKKASEGYDAAIVYWSKRWVSMKNVIKRLREKQ